MKILSAVNLVPFTAEGMTNRFEARHYQVSNRSREYLCPNTLLSGASRHSLIIRSLNCLVCTYHAAFSILSVSPCRELSKTFALPHEQQESAHTDDGHKPCGDEAIL